MQITVDFPKILGYNEENEEEVENMVEQGNPGRQQYVDRITQQLATLANKAKISSTGNRNDTAVISEDTVCGLLNLMKGWNLKNANTPGNPNFPGVDLMDEEAGVAVQVTVNNTRRKVDDMLETFKKNKLNRKFNTLILLVLTQENPTKSMLEREDSCFYGERDIWNIPRLIREIEHEKSVEKLRKIAEYLDKELGYVSIAFHEDINTTGKKRNVQHIPRNYWRDVSLFAVILLVVLSLGIAVRGKHREETEQGTQNNAAGEHLNHNWQNATCTTAKICTVCGKEEGDPLDHDWQEATCTTPKTCSRCGKIEGTTTEHRWIEATYAAPRTCEVCRETEGEPLQNPVAELLREQIPVVMLIMDSSWRLYGYEDETLTRKIDSCYLDPDKGQVVISGISEDGTAVEVNYPSDSKPSGYAVHWFPLADIIPLETVDVRYYNSGENIDTYRLLGDGVSLQHYGKTGTKYCLLGMHGSGYYVVLYEVSEQSLFGIAVESKIALVKIRP